MIHDPKLYVKMCVQIIEIVPLFERRSSKNVLRFISLLRKSLYLSTGNLYHYYFIMC